MMAAPQVFVGMDVANAHLDIALRPTGERWAVTNDEPGIAILVARLQAMQPTLIGLEATGGYHRAVVAARAAAALPIVVVNPRQVRDFAKATWPVGQNGPPRGPAVAHCAEAVRPVPRPLPDAQTAEPNRLEHASPRRRADIAAPIAWLDQRVAALDDDLDTTLWASPIWRERETRYRSVPGMGPVCARTLRLALPE
jgi:transposase